MRAIWLMTFLVAASPVAAQLTNYPDDRSTIIVEGIRNRRAAS